MGKDGQPKDDKRFTIILQKDLRNIWKNPINARGKTRFHKNGNGEMR